MRPIYPILIFSFIFFSINLHAQTIETFDFMGSINAGGSGSFSYRLQFDIKNGQVTGYSITDYLGSDETKTSIKGTYDYSSKVLKYSEVTLEYTKSTYESDLCYIFGECTLGSKGKTATLNGSFVGKYVNNDTCANGTMSLMSTDYLIKKAKKIQKVVSKLEKQNKDTLTDFETIKYENTTLKSDESITFDWSSNVLKLHLWDQGLEDGDQINVLVNGKLVLINYTIRKTEKILPVTLKEGENVIEIKALNEGKTFPNTVSVSLQDGNKKYKLVTYLVKNSSAKIVVNR